MMSDGSTGRPPPLEGVTVLALEHAVAAPLASRHLADLGARVIKVERPGTGDFARGYDQTVNGQSSYFVWLNRGKQSIELDLTRQDDVELLLRMLDHADVLLQNLAPGAVERLGLDAATLRQDRPSLIHCSISGFGEGGPYGTRKAYDLMMQCETGLVEATGTPQASAKAGISVADIATGMYAYSGILTALYTRARGGDGATLTVSLLDAMAEWMQQPAYHAAYGDTETRRTGAHHASIAPYGPYLTGDGELVFLAVQNDREWRRFCAEVLDCPSYGDDPRFAGNAERAQRGPELSSLIEGVFSALSTGQVIELLDRVGIASARARTPRQLFDHPQLLARSRWRRVESPGGAIQALVPPLQIAGVDALMRPVPRLGQDNIALRSEFEPSPRTAANVTSVGSSPRSEVT